MTAKAPTTALRDEPAFLSNQPIVSSPPRPARSYDPESTSLLINLLVRVFLFVTLLVLGSLMFLSADKDTDFMSLLMFGLASFAWAFLSWVKWVAWRKRVEEVKRERKRDGRSKEDVAHGEGDKLLRCDDHETNSSA